METLEIKDINLLYTNWEGDTRIPNGRELGLDEINFIDFSGYILTHLNDLEYSDDNRKFNINYVKLSEYRSDKTYFYAISHTNSSFQNILDDVLPINDTIIELSKKHNNIYFIYSHEHEGDSGNIGGLLSSRIMNYNLDESKFIIINNNSAINQYMGDYDFKVHKSNFIPYSYSRVLRNVESDFVINKQGKFFMCRNRSPKDHRISLLIKLFLNKTIYDFNYSFITETDSIRRNLFTIIKYFDVKFFRENQELINTINSTIKVDDYELEKNWINPETGDFQSNQPEIFRVPELNISFENSYVNVVTESLYEEHLQSVHISEKSYRPFFYYQFPIFVASPNHVQYLRELGFDVFDDLINHNYDYNLDDKERLDMVADEIKKIHNNQDTFKDFYSKNKDRFIKNRKTYFDIACKLKEKDTDLLWNLI